MADTLNFKRENAMICPHCGKYFNKMKKEEINIKTIIALHEEGLSVRAISRKLNGSISYSTVQRYIDAYRLANTIGLLKEDKSSIKKKGMK